MALKSIMHNFAGGTTMHGVPKAIRAQSVFARIFWSIVCLAAAAMFSYQFIQLLQKYYSYPKKVTIEIVPPTVPFPAISLCNMRNLDIMVLNTLNEIFKAGDGGNATEDGNSTGPAPSEPFYANMSEAPFINAYMDTVSKYFYMYQNQSLHMKIFQTILTRTLVASNMDRQLVSQAGVPFHEFIVTCRYGGLPCNRDEDFSQFFDSYYYNCFTYVAPEPPKGQTALAEGLENGWSTIILTGNGMLQQNDLIRMIPGTHDHSSPMASSEGVRVVIHPPSTQPYPHTEGFDVQPGVSVTFGVKARQNIRIGPPHGNCSDFDPMWPNQKSSYRLISCQKKCLQKHVVEVCGCKDINLPAHEHFPHHKFCTNDDDIPDECGIPDYYFEHTSVCLDALFQVYNRFMCVRNTTAQLSRNATFTRDCKCFPPCHEVSYDVTYSLSKWPAEGFDGEEAWLDIFETENYPERFEGNRKKFDLYSNYFDASNRANCMKQFGRLNVYIADSNILKTEESEDYTQSQLLSDIGGQLGLWVGISVITLAEVLELIVHVCQYFGSRHGPYSAGKQFSRDPEYTNYHEACRACRAQAHSNGTIPLTAVDDPMQMV